MHLCDSLNPAGLGGYESYLHYLSRIFTEDAHSSFIVTQSPEHDSELIVPQEYYDLYHLSGNYLEARKWQFLSSPQDQWIHLAEEMFVPDDLVRNIEALISQLQELITTLKPDVIHAHSTYVVFNHVLEEMSEFLIENKIPVVATVHGLPKPLILPSGESTTDYDQLVGCCPFDCVLAVSDIVESTLREYFAAVNVDQNIRRLYIGIDTDTFHPDPKAHKKWDVAFLGRFEYMKAVDLFPEMLEILKDRFPKLKMVMTGVGSLFDVVFDELEERNVSHMVEYLGVVEMSKMPEIINASKVFLYPSREEPFGLSIIEAMACDVPVITTNVFGPKEIITHGHDGYMVNPSDAQELVEALITLLTDKNLYTNISNNARKTVESKFDMKNQSAKLLDIYRKLISKKKR
jgi:glycosyltransferase involved in cell wall biosynthesis